MFTDYVFFHKDGRPIKGFRKAWRKACLAAGLAEEVEVGKTKTGKKITKIIPLRIIHNFRRTTVRNLVRAGIHRKLTMELAGHKPEAVFRRYNITSAADIEDAASKLNAFSKNSVTGTV